MNKTEKKYDTNFTAGGLLHNEFEGLESIIFSPDRIALINLEIEENNVLAIDTKSARQRIVSEINRRIDNAPNNFWEFYYNLDIREKRIALFYVCLKTYPLIFDIHFEVTVKKQKSNSALTSYDIQMRLDEIASTNENVANWSESTIKKIITQYKKVLTDSELLNEENLIKNNIHNPIFWQYFKSVKDSWFLTACFKDL